MPYPVTNEWSRPCVLVVDDDSDTRWMTEQALSRDCDVIGSASHADAIARARQRRPSLILLDLELGGESGWDVMRSLQTDPALRAIPVVILSGHAAQQPAPDDLRPCAAYLSKPCRMSDLRRVVAALRR